MVRVRRVSTAVVAAAVIMSAATAWAAPTTRAAPGADAVPHAGGTPPHAFVQPALGARTVQGLDVSHWQNSIDFSLVKTAGYRFVYAKATEGQTFVDPNYTTYRADAGAQHIIVGAYHFARPDATPNDAILEADHFASVAAPVSDDLVPVLDIEDAGGLSSADLTAWVQAWLDRVTADVGVQPAIYSGPIFWRTSMDNTTTFADEGYRILWVANWGVSRPDVPAHDWGGASWTFWQWTDCGVVPGIAGCVDLDLLRGGSLGKARIP